jgi:putative ABC transport system permease protein
MKFTDIIRTANSNLLRSKARTFLTIIAIFIGAMTITLTNGIGTGIKSYLHSQIGDLGATNVLIVTLKQPSSSTSSGPAKYKYNPNSIISSGGLGQNSLMMNNNDLKIIGALPKISNVVASYSPAPDYIAGTSSKYQISVAQQFGESTADMLAGKVTNVNSSSNQISIPKNYVGPLGYSSPAAIVGKSVTLGITSAEGKQSIVTATVSGVQQKNLFGQASAYSNTALSDRLNDIQNEGVPSSLANSFMTAYATFPSSLSQVQINSLKNQLTNKGFTAKTIKDEEDTIFKAIDAIIIVLDMLGVIALLAASFGIINTLLMSVQERTKEIGLMKALGMSSKRIFVLFSFEAVLIGMWGSVIGVLIAAGIGSLINDIGKHSFLKDFPGLSLLTFPLATVIIVILVIMLIAFIAGTLPALRASKKNPIEALRYE